MFFWGEKASDKKVQMELLKSIAMFEDLPDEIIETILEKADRRTIENGDFLIREGEEAEDFFIVLRGRFNVMVHKTTVAEILPGDPVGEIAFFAGGTRTADVLASRNSEVLQFTREVYHGLSGDIPQIAWGIISALGRRLAAANTSGGKKVTEGHRSVALMATTDGGLTQGLLDGVRGEIESLSDWKVVDETLRDQEVSEDSTAAFSEWLAGMEEDVQNILIICQNPEREKNWSDAIAAHSDSVFLVGANAVGEAGPVPLSPFEQTLMNVKKGSQIQLILWREEKQHRGKFSRNWLRTRPVKFHHQLALDAKDDFERLASFLKGKTADLFN